MLPYTYLIGWSQLDTYYYGVRYAQGCEPSELWSSYFTSSKHVKLFREQHGEPDVIQVRKTFTSASDAIDWETRVLKRLDAHLNPRFLNKTNNKAISNDRAHYERLGRLSKERRCPEELKKHLSELAKTPERQAISRATFQKFGNRGVYEVTKPSGETLIVRGLQQFCRDEGISYCSMSSSVKKGGGYKGYSVKKIGSEGILRSHLSPP